MIKTANAKPDWMQTVDYEISRLQRKNQGPLARVSGRYDALACNLSNYGVMWGIFCILIAVVDYIRKVQGITLAVVTATQYTSVHMSAGFGG